MNFRRNNKKLLKEKKEIRIWNLLHRNYVNIILSVFFPMQRLLERRAAPVGDALAVCRKSGARDRRTRSQQGT